MPDFSSLSQVALAATTGATLVGAFVALRKARVDAADVAVGIATRMMKTADERLTDAEARLGECERDRQVLSGKVERLEKQLLNLRMAEQLGMLETPSWRYPEDSPIAEE